MERGQSRPELRCLLASYHPSVGSQVWSEDNCEPESDQRRVGDACPATDEKRVVSRTLEAGLVEDRRRAHMEGALQLITKLPVLEPPPLPFRLRRSGALPVVCAAYSVSCIEGTVPVRGLLERRPAGTARFAPRDFCDSGGAYFTSLPPQIGAPHLVPSQREMPCTCPSVSLLPNHGHGVLPLTPCTAGSSFTLLQCSRHPLAPLPSAASAASAAARASRGGPSRGGIDVLLAVSDNAGHGLFATVERVINQVLYARAKGLEPFVYVGELAFAEGTACEHGPQPYFDAPQVGRLRGTATATAEAAVRTRARARTRARRGRGSGLGLELGLDRGQGQGCGAKPGALPRRAAG